MAEILAHKENIAVYQQQLPTELADPEGYIKRTKRKTTIEVYPTNSGKGWLYEMGIR